VQPEVVAEQVGLGPQRLVADQAVVALGIHRSPMAELVLLVTLVLTHPLKDSPEGTVDQVIAQTPLLAVAEDPHRLDLVVRLQHLDQTA